MNETILKPLNHSQNPYPDEMMLDLYNTDKVENDEKTPQQNSKKSKDKDEEEAAILLEHNSSLPMAETEMLAPATESASSQAVKATTVSTSSSDGNGAVWGILGGLVGLGAIAGLAGGSKGGKSSGEPQAQNVPMTPTPTPTVTPITPPAPEKTTIKIHYSDLKSDVYAGQTDVKFDYAPVRYVAKKISVSEEFIQTQYLKKFGTNKITQNIEQAYARDSDNDGVIDRNDANPNTWDVSERDLRMFAELSYGKTKDLSPYINQPSDKSITVLQNQFDSRTENQIDFTKELLGKWTVLQIYTDGEIFGTGADFVVLGNGKKANGSYENVVVAFRGTQKTSPKDLWADLRLMNGKLPSQVKMLDDLAENIMTEYKPKNVYSTGHSLGGYLAQYFASYVMQQNPERSKAFKHSALFNTAKLTVQDDSPSELKQAFNYTENTMVRQDYIDKSDKMDIKNLKQTNSYVITGEWVSAGFHNVAKNVIDATGTVGGAWAGAATGGKLGSIFGPIGAGVGAAIGAIFGGWAGKKAVDKVSFDGLGTYTNSTMLDFRQDDLWGKHSLVSFFKQNNELKYLFSKGYRMDKHYLHDDVDNDGLTDYQEKRLGTDSKQATVLKGKDTDKDGFSDRLEIELGSNWLDSKKIIDLKEYYSISAQEKQLLALVETHTEKGKFLGVQGMEMNAKVENNQLVYTPNASPLNLGITQDTEWQAFLQSGKNIIQGDSQNNVLEAKGEMQILYGASGNDILKTSTGVDILVGGSGQDTFVLTEESIKSGKMDFISDFAAEDKLNLSALKSIFNINHLNLKWSDLLTTQAQDNDALVWNEQEHTLSYQSRGLQNVHVLAKFDDDVDMARISAGLIG